VCKSSREPGGPRRCSSDARDACQHSSEAIAVLEARQSAAQAALEVRGTGVDAMPSGLRRAVPRCFFCDDLTGEAAHLTRYGKVCCPNCWPDVRLTQGPGGGL
jgi:hypothetical protein